MLTNYSEPCLYAGVIASIFFLTWSSISNTKSTSCIYLCVFLSVFRHDFADQCCFSPLVLGYVNIPCGSLMGG